MLDGARLLCFQVSAGWRERVGHVCKEKDEGRAGEGEGGAGGSVEEEGRAGGSVEGEGAREEVKSGPADKKAAGEVSGHYLGVPIL